MNESARQIAIGVAEVALTISVLALLIRMIANCAKHEMRTRPRVTWIILIIGLWIIGEPLFLCFVIFSVGRVRTDREMLKHSVKCDAYPGCGSRPYEFFVSFLGRLGRPLGCVLFG